MAIHTNNLIIRRKLLHYMTLISLGTFFIMLHCLRVIQVYSPTCSIRSSWADDEDLLLSHYLLYYSATILLQLLVLCEWERKVVAPFRCHTPQSGIDGKYMIFYIPKWEPDANMNFMKEHRLSDTLVM